MAEEKKLGGGNGDIGPLEIIIGIILLFLVFSSLFQNFNSKVQSAERGTLWGDIRFFFAKTESTFGVKVFAEPLAIGQSVRTIRASILYAFPGGSVLKGIQQDLEGVIVDGPVEYDGSRFFKVQFEGALGYVTENTLTDRLTGTLTDDATGPLGNLYVSLRYVSTAISFIFLIGIAYVAIRAYQIRQEEFHRLHEHGSFFVDAGGHGVDAEVRPVNHKWQLIEKHLHSDSENDWRLAILEADIMLDGLVKAKAWQGENLGERLKNADRSDFHTLDKAWEAHKVRNMIAHEGANYALSNREARRVIGLFEEVFREFGAI